MDYCDIEWFALETNRDPSVVFEIASKAKRNYQKIARVSKFSKVVGYKVNTQKSLVLLYTNNEKSEREIKESIPFTIATKRIKHLGIKLPKETKDVYMENCKTPMMS